jgi:hypothetical protein
MPYESPVTSEKPAVAGFDAVLIDLLLSVLFASHHLEGSCTVCLNRACFCFDRSCGEARLSDEGRLQCGLPSARALPRRGPQLGTMIDESTPVVDDDLEHDPEKWKPVFRKDHARTKR